MNNEGGRDEMSDLVDVTLAPQCITYVLREPTLDAILQCLAILFREYTYIYISRKMH